MRVLSSLIALAAMVAPAVAAECNSGRSDILVPTSIVAGPDEVRGKAASAIRIEFDYRGDKAVRLVDAGFVVENVLGRMIGPPSMLPSTFDLSPGGSGSFEFTWLGTELTDTNPADIMVTICVRGVVYDDGTKEEF